MRRAAKDLSNSARLQQKRNRGEVRSTGRYWSYALRWLGSLTLIAIVAYHVDVSQALEMAQRVQVEILLLAFCFLLLERVFISARWPILVRFKGHKISFWEAFRIDWESIFIGLAMPSMLTTEAVRGYRLFQLIDDLRTSFSAILMDRMIGIFTLALSVVLSLILGWRVFGITTALVSVIVFLATFAIVILTFMNSWHTRYLEYKFPSLTDYKIWRYLSALNQDFIHYRSSLRMIAAMLLLAILAQGCRVLVVWFVSLSAGVQLPFFYLLLFTPILFLVKLLPISIGGFGIREVSLTLLFTAAGESGELGALVGALISILALLFSLPGGLFLLQYRRAARIDSN